LSLGAAVLEVAEPFKASIELFEEIFTPSSLMLEVVEPF